MFRELHPLRHCFASPLLDMQRGSVCTVTAFLLGICLADCVVRNGLDDPLEELHTTLDGGDCVLPPKVTSSLVPQPVTVVPRDQIRVSSREDSVSMASSTEVHQPPISFSLWAPTVRSGRRQFSKTTRSRDHGCCDTAKGLLLGRYPRRQLSDCLTQPARSAVIVSRMTFEGVMCGADTVAVAGRLAPPLPFPTE